MAGLSLFTVVLVVAALVVLLRDDTHRATPGVPVADGPRPGAAAATLHLLEEAVESHDPDAARALAPGGDAAAATLLAAVADNAGALDVTDFSARYVDETGAAAEDGSWTAQVALTWGFAGFDPEPAGAEVAVDLRAGRGRGGDPPVRGRPATASSRSGSRSRWRCAAATRRW